MQKIKLGLLTLMAFATLAACGDVGDESPPAVEDPQQETPGEETPTPGEEEGEDPALGGDVEEDENDTEEEDDGQY